MTGKTIHASIRRLYSAAAQAGDDSPAKVARRMNVSAQTLNNWEARGISQAGSLSAQDVYGCDAVWLITGKGARTAGVADQKGTYASHSQPLRLDPAMIAETHHALQRRYANAGGYNIEEQPEIFVIAYNIRAGITDASVPQNVVDLVIEHADLTPQGADADGRRDGVPLAGTTERRAGTGRGRKT